MAKILIIDDEPQLRALLARIIGLEGYDVEQAPDCTTGLRLLSQYESDVVLCDVKLPDGNGVELVGRIKEIAPAAEVILLTAYGNIPDGVQAIKNGAFDYITKGDDNNKILPLLSRATEKARMQRRLARFEAKLSDEHSFDRIIGSSEALRQAVNPQIISQHRRRSVISHARYHMSSDAQIFRRHSHIYRTASGLHLFAGQKSVLSPLGPAADAIINIGYESAQYETFVFHLNLHSAAVAGGTDSCERFFLRPLPLRGGSPRHHSRQQTHGLLFQISSRRRYGRFPPEFPYPRSPRCRLSDSRNRPESL